MPLAIYPWQEALSRDLEIFRHRMPSGIIVSARFYEEPDV